MPTTTLFIGSSSAAKSQAKAIVAKFSSPTVKFIPWWDAAFTPGRTLLEELDAIKGKVNGALLLFSPEAQTISRKQKRWVPNLNVLFEFGYFYGRLGPKKVAMIKYGDFFLPTDLGGHIWITGSKGFTRNGAVAVGKRTESDFTKWIQKL